ncbi:DNA translocase FtsK [Siphonobacter sp. SORGH_AS_0500]|uniref:FtsK/SpoIIIE family DNA translocase n=1 Tax=Siphonobacter sp. SORGH_AS_0500 TaxID=1864824 RepID=UPI0028570962|nr:DNA translocase FtsK [Siphonobacter sp. SORGH_AS_0500]MDR6194384.1 S-DNA-T family DNA segregation ATPase FtsK/SpoIIIE [Siphonobacter sp. SORGH_AS_0500]
MAKKVDSAKKSSSKPASLAAKSFKPKAPGPSTRLVVGGLTILLSVLLFLAFFSYLISGEADQSVVGSAFKTSIHESGQKVQNWLGLTGAVVAHFFVFQWFGIASFLIIPVLLVAGIKMTFAREIFPLKRLTYQAIFYTLWVSSVLGFVVLYSNSQANLSTLSGGIGLLINQLLYNLIGWGSIAVIAASLFVFVIYFYRVDSLEHVAEKVEGMKVPKPSISNPFKNLFKELEETEEEEELEPETEKPTPVAKEIPKPAPRIPFAVEPKIEIEEEPEPEEPEEDLEQIQLEKVNRLAEDARRVLETPVRLPVELKPEVEPEPEPAFEEVEAYVPPVTVNGSGNKSTPKAGNAEPDFIIEQVPAEEILPQKKIEKLDTKPNENLIKELGLYDPTLDLARYEYPGVDLLKEYAPDKAQVSEEELKSKKDTIVRTLSDYGISIASIKATPGPTVTLYEIIPSAGVKISRIKSLEDDIALSLAALGIRIIAPMPGKGTIGIEVPNKNREMVSIRAVVASEKFQKSTAELPVVLGKTISNEIFVTDLAKMPHLLIAGATGQGKSVGMNVILASLLYKKHPSQLKLVLVDPKKVELSLFSKIERHFLAKLPGTEDAIITDTKKVIYTLNSLCVEMDSRYELLKNAGCRNLKEYNQKFIERRLNPEKGHRFLPYIVLVIDELADLMMTAGKEVETPIARLAQLARAIGIHLIVATQRPSVDIITGKIKANFPARLSFKVTQKVDSRTILDTSGADQLVGQGDMLFLQGSDMTRLQCAFVDTPEVDAICDFIGEQQGYSDAYLLPEFEGDESGNEEKNVDLAQLDPMYKDAARLIVIHQQGSTSLIQRKMKLGYNRAGRIMDQLEATGVVGPFEGSKAREVLIQSEERLEELFKELRL